MKKPRQANAERGLNHFNFYNKNAREWTLLNTSNFGKVVHCEIGALCIGKIKNHHETHIFKKGEEKGYFEFGGSTIIQLIKKDKVKINKQIVENSKNDVETYVAIGDVLF